MIINECKLNTYNDDNVSMEIGEGIVVRSYSDDPTMVVLKVSGKKYIVSSTDLFTAIDNCTNINK